MITKEQLRAARGLLGWSARALAEKADLGITAVQRLEDGRVQISRAKVETIERLKRALEDGGVEFTPDGGVRPRKRNNQADGQRGHRHG